MSTSGLKRLNWVPQTLASGQNLAERAYTTARSYTPGALESSISNLEHQASSVASPIISRAQDLGTQAIKIVDNQVDFAVVTADKTFATGKKSVFDSMHTVQNIHHANMKTFGETSSHYYHSIEQFAHWAADKLNPIRGGQAALDTLKAAIEKAKAATDPDVAAKMATDAWSSFASTPVVAKVLSTADPVTKTALGSFYKLHDSVVGWTLYKKAVDTGLGTLSWATTTLPYKLGATHLYPIIAPIANPQLDKFSKSHVINDTLGYWKPTAISA